MEGSFEDRDETKNPGTEDGRGKPMNCPVDFQREPETEHPAIDHAGNGRSCENQRAIDAKHRGFQPRHAAKAHGGSASPSAVCRRSSGSGSASTQETDLILMPFTRKINNSAKIMPQEKRCVFSNDPWKPSFSGSFADRETARPHARCLIPCAMCLGNEQVATRTTTEERSEAAGSFPAASPSVSGVISRRRTG
jgi:hypothetical protein